MDPRLAGMVAQWHCSFGGCDAQMVTYALVPLPDVPCQHALPTCLVSTPSQPGGLHILVRALHNRVVIQVGVSIVPTLAVLTE